MATKTTNKKATAKARSTKRARTAKRTGAAKKKPRPSLRTDRTLKKKKAGFLEMLARGSSVQGAAAAVAVGRSTVYEWRAKDAEFADGWDAAIEAGTDLMEDEARRRAVEGMRKPLSHLGHFTGEWVDKNGNPLPELVISDPDRLEQAKAKGAHWRQNVVAEYSDTLLMFLLKGRRPEKFRERFEHSGPGGAPLDRDVRIVVISGKTTAATEREINAELRRLDGDDQ